MLLIVSLAVAVAGAAAACDNGEAATDDTLPPPASTTSTTAVSYDVPDTIDAAYAERVMAALDQIYGDAVRHLARTRVVDEDFLRPLVAIHNPRIFGLVQDLWVKKQANDFAGLRQSPADPRTRVVRLIRADRDCLAFEGDRDVSPLYEADDPTSHHKFVALTPLPGNRNPGQVNPTPWTINFSGETTAGSLPEDACVPQ